MSEDFECQEGSVTDDLFVELVEESAGVSSAEEPLLEGGEPIPVDLVDDCKGHGADNVTADKEVVEMVSEIVADEEDEMQLQLKNKMKQMKEEADKEAFFILYGMKKEEKVRELPEQAQDWLDESDYLPEAQLKRRSKVRTFEDRGGHYFKDQLGEPVKLKYSHGDHLKDPREALLNKVSVNGFGERTIKGFTLASDKLKMEQKGRVFRHSSEPAVKAKRFF